MEETTWTDPIALFWGVFILGTENISLKIKRVQSLEFEKNT